MPDRREIPERTLSHTMKKNGESWGLYIAKWVMGIASALVTAAIIYGASSSVQTQKDMVGVKATLESHGEAINAVDKKIEDLEIPPPLFEEKVDRIDANLQEHMRQSGNRAHSGGGGGA